jgi:hypothetical protein
MASVNQSPGFFQKKTLTGSKMDPVLDKIPAAIHLNDNNYPSTLNNLTHYLSVHCFFQHNIPELSRLRNSAASRETFCSKCIQFQLNCEAIAEKTMVQREQDPDSTGVN